MSEISYVNLRYFIFLSICSGIFAVTKITKYSQAESLNGRKCLASNIVFVERNIVSVAECVTFCSRKASCFGISYRQSAQECVGCNEEFLLSNVSDGFENSLFFSQDYCPDKNGRIQFDVNFRLQIFTAVKNQSEAELDCERELNGRLAIFDEEWKINAIENVLLSCAGYNSTVYWVDGTRTDSSSEWKFIGERNIPMSETIFWNPNNPNSNYPGRVCLRLKYHVSEGYGFNDKKCHYENPFICEY